MAYSQEFSYNLGERTDSDTSSIRLIDATGYFEFTKGSVTSYFDTKSCNQERLKVIFDR